MAIMTLFAPQANLVAPSPSTKLTPPLKWAGGKRWLIPTLRKLWEPYAELPLLEPFVGGMAVALGLHPQRAILNDINRHLINFYQWLQKGLTATLPMENDSVMYYRYRDRFNELIKKELSDTAESAALFYYLNRTGYNGLCRFNQKGYFNVPFGRYKTINYTKDFTDYQQLLTSWTLLNTDFKKINLTQNIFIYADPPYDVDFTSYSAGGFDWNDQVELAHWLAQHVGPVVTSNQATPRIIKLYTLLGFDIQIVDAPRRISCTGDRNNASEMLAVKGIDYFNFDNGYLNHETIGRLTNTSRSLIDCGINGE